MTEDSIKEIRSFLDHEGKLTGFPAKRKKKLLAVYYLFEQIPEGRIYTEKEFNVLLNSLHTFGDPATIRREMVDYGLVTRGIGGTDYQRAADPPSLDQVLEML